MESNYFCLSALTTIDVHVYHSFTLVVLRALIDSGLLLHLKRLS